MQPLNDEDLKQILGEWKAPRAPASLESRVRAGRQFHSWHWLLWGRIQVPVPVGALAVAALVLLSVLAFRSPPEAASNPVSDVSNFRLVDDLNPRVIRSSYEND